jgi:opacity protein-like surface antigen
MKIAASAMGCLAMLLAWPLVAQAAPADEPTTKFYVGLDVGSSKFNATLSEQFFSARTSQPSGTDLGFKVHAGIQISRYFAVEAGYADFGEITVKGIPYSCAMGSPPPCTYNVSSNARGPSTNIVGIWPFAEHWALKARVGGQYAHTSTTERDPDVTGSNRRYSEDSLGFMYGAGLSYRLNPRMTLGLNWERNDQIEFGVGLGGGAGVYDLGTSTLTSLGFSYRF